MCSSNKEEALENEFVKLFLAFSPVAEVALANYAGIVLSIQWNLQLKDTLGAAILSFFERLSSSRRLKMNYHYGKGVQKSVLCWEVVPFSEGPLSEVPL